MSRGLGRIQSIIVQLLEADEEGAFTTTDICAAVYRGTNRAEKKHRVAVARAMRTMSLPETWFAIRGGRRGGETIIYNRLSMNSTCRFLWLDIYGADHCSFEKFCSFYGHQLQKAAKKVAEYRRYFEADELGRLSMDIKNAQTRLGLMCSIGAGGDFARRVGEEVQALMKRRNELQAGLNVSGSQIVESGNTYSGGAA